MEEPKDNLWLALVFGGFVFLFLLVFKPFDFIKHQQDSILISAGFGLVTTVVVILNFLILHKVVNTLFSADDWKLKHTFYASIWNIATIAVGNYFYMVLTSDTDNNFSELLKAVYYTVSIGIFPVIIILIYSEHQLLKNNQTKASKTTSFIENKSLKPITKAPAKDIIELKADISSDNFTLDLKALLFIKADGNYSTFFMDRSSEKQKIIKRISLKSVDEQIKKHPKLIRCHRSYIIDIDKVKNVSGNARNISLHFDEKLIVPISRTKEKEVLSAIRHDYKGK